MNISSHLFLLCNFIVNENALTIIMFKLGVCAEFAVFCDNNLLILIYRFSNKRLMNLIFCKVSYLNLQIMKT